MSEQIGKKDTQPHKEMKVLAIGAHPDDIEFMMGGTLLLLKKAGAVIYFWNLADGVCGTTRLSKKDIVNTRRDEAIHAAEVCGAVDVLPPIAEDLMLLYDEECIRKTAAGIRKVRPDIILAPSPDDYMEDHQNASRLAVTGAFARRMKNFDTIPQENIINNEITLYHALPYGLRDGMGNRVHPQFFVDIADVIDEKERVLEKHRSQKEWLDVSQGLNAYLENMKEMSAEVGKMSCQFDYAEGWRRHLHLGLCGKDRSPLEDILVDSLTLNA